MEKRGKGIAYLAVGTVLSGSGIAILSLNDEKSMWIWGILLTIAGAINIYHGKMMIKDN